MRMLHKAFSGPSGPRPVTEHVGMTGRRASREFSRRDFLRCTAELGTAAAMTCLIPGCGSGPNQVAEQPKAKRPNIVVIIVDTLRADKLGCYGYSEDTSPEIDYYAASGARFDRVIAQCSWTRPSIGSMLTSLYPRTLGLYVERNQTLPEEFVTLAEILRKHGYRTAGLVSNANINRVFGFAQGFDYFLDVDPESAWGWMPEARRTIENREEKRKMVRTARQLYERALGLAAATPPGKPSFLFLTVMEVHERDYLDGQIIRPEFSSSYARSESPRYLQAVRQVSVDTGEFMRQLLSLPGWEDTLVVITSDHGEGLKDHPHVRDSESHGRLLYESQVLVPLIFYQHGRNLGGGVIKPPVRLLDMMPTILDYVGLPIPDQCVGISLCRHMRGQAGKSEFPTEFTMETHRLSNMVGIYGDQWYYVVSRQNRQPWGTAEIELQEIGVKADGQRTNKLRSHPKVARDLAERLAAWQKAYPPRPATPRGSAIPEHERKVLRSMGYVG